MKGDRGEQVGY